MRADNAAMNGQKLDVNMVYSPRQTENQEREAAEKALIRQNILNQLHGGRQKELTTE